MYDKHSTESSTTSAALLSPEEFFPPPKPRQIEATDKSKILLAAGRGVLSTVD
jgi:hypothetical protein